MAFHSVQKSVAQTFGFGQHLPVMLQTEATECGLACLAMVAGYHGLHTDLATLRRRFSVSLKGTTVKAMTTVANAMHLSSRVLKVELEDLERLDLPCVLHWDMNHFVVLKSVSGKKAVIHDPAVGVVNMQMEDVSRRYTGIVMELKPDANFEKREEKQQFTLFGLMGRVTGFKRSLLQVMCMALALEVMAVVAPFYMQWVVDHALLTADTDLLTVLGLGFILLTTIKAGASAMRTWVLTVLGTNLNFQWLGNVFSHLLKLPLDYFEKRHLGDIVSRFGSVSTIQRTLTAAFAQVLVDGILVIGTLGMMTWYNWQLTGIALVAVLLYAMMRWAVYQPLRDASTEQIIHVARQSTHFLETTRGMQSIRLFGRSQERRMGWMNMLVDQFNSDLRIQKITNIHKSANMWLFGIERIIIIWLGALAVIHNEFSVGMLFAFIAYKDQFSTRITELTDKLYELYMLRLHGDRVADIVLSDAEPTGMADELEMARIEPAITITGLDFQYSSLDPKVLQDVNLHIEAGECVAISGSSGCGKTTLVKLLLGLLQPTAGSITVGGIDIKQMGLENYRKLVGTVMQEDSLFTGSIADNISFFDPAADMAQIEESATMASIHKEIMAMPMGYNSLIGDVGSGLSGGQKQRVLLARALYKKPKILILDEATSHLDVMREKVVNDGIKRMNLTRIIIAHRPETIFMANRVVVMEQGRIVRCLNDVALQAMTSSAPVSVA